MYVVMRRLKCFKRVSVRGNAVMNDVMKYNMYNSELIHLEHQLSLKLGWTPAKITALTCAHVQFKSMIS